MRPLRVWDGMTRGELRAEVADVLSDAPCVTDAVDLERGAELLCGWSPERSRHRVRRLRPSRG